MRGRYPSLQGYLGARLRTIYQSVLDFESGVVRLPGELAELFAGLRERLDEALNEYEERLAEAGDDQDLRAKAEARYLTFAHFAGIYADLFTTGTDPDSLPAGLHGILADLFSHRPDGHLIVLRATDAQTFWTYALFRPEQLKPGAPLLDRAGKADESVREPLLVSVFDVPRSFRDSALLLLVVAGHELPHAEDQATNFEYRGNVLKTITLPSTKNAEADELTGHIVVGWIDEVFADVVSVRRMGPAAILVFAEYARLVGAYGAAIPPIVWEPHFAKHPPAEVRLFHMFATLDGLGLAVDAFGDFGPALEQWRMVARDGASLPPGARKEFRDADGIVRAALGQIQAQAASLVPPHRAFREVSLRRAHALADRFAAGIAPSDQIIDANLATSPIELADLYNAAALVRAVPARLDVLVKTMGLDLDKTMTVEQRRARALGQLDELLARAIEGLRMRAAWPDVLWDEPQR